MSEPNTPFPISMRGYDRDAVAAFVGQLEDQVRDAQREAAAARTEAARIQADLESAQGSLREAAKPTYTGLGSSNSSARPRSSPRTS